MLIRIHWWQRDMDALRSSLERLAESAEAADLIEEERYALTQLVRLAPDEQRYLDRLNLLGGLQDETPEDLLSQSEPAEIPQFETFGANEHEHSEPAGGVSFVEFETNGTPDSSLVDPTSSFADLNDATDASKRESNNAASFQEVDFSLVGLADSESPATAEPGHLESVMKQELESVDFYIAQGYTDIALDTLVVLEKQFGAHAEIQSRRDKLNAGKSTPAAPAVFEFGGTDELTAEEETVSLEADMTFVSLADDDASVSETGEKPAGKGIDSGLAELFEEFRVAEEEDTGLEDFETHYNMGTAYKEMDLLDEAVQEFQTSVALVKASDGTSRFLQCCNMLGHCFVQKGLPEAAIMWFKKGLAAPGHSEDEYQALRYELGGAYEEMGDIEQAKQHYTEVYGVDVNYREVGEKLRNLKKKK